MLPLDVVRIIVQFCPLQTRWFCSFLSRLYFPFSEKDWIAHGRRFQLTTRQQLRLLYERNYRSRLSISRRLNLLWSNHFQVPLAIWSPWTIKRFCRRSLKRMDFYFREYRFVLFVRELGQKYKIKTPCLRKINLHDCVHSTIWFSTTKRLEMVVHNNNSTKKRYCVESSLKSYAKTRALFEFRIVQGQLVLKIRKLEFWV